MAALLTLADVKLHCRIDNDDEDSLLGALIATATTAVADYMNVTSVDSTAAAPVKSAALLLVGDLYENREAQTDRQLFRNQAFDRLLAPYRAYT